MNKRRLFFFFISLVFLEGSILHALEVPKRPQGYVTDKANLLSSQTRIQLEQALRSYEQQTTNQIVVVTFPSLEGDSLEAFSIRLAEAWKVGQKGKDNGVIFLIFPKDRKMRIEVGYGLEGAIPDALAGQIIQQVVAPAFRMGEFEKGILLGVKSIMQAAQGEFKAAQNTMGRSPYGSRSYQRELTPEEIAMLRERGEAIGKFILILVALFFVIDFFRYRAYHKEHKVYRNRYSFWEWWFRFAILLFILNIVFRIALYSMLFSRGGYYGGRSGFSGFSGGGGSFGGGGASGGW